MFPLLKTVEHINVFSRKIPRMLRPTSWRAEELVAVVVMSSWVRAMTCSRSDFSWINSCTAISPVRKVTFAHLHNNRISGIQIVIKHERKNKFHDFSWFLQRKQCIKHFQTFIEFSYKNEREILAGCQCGLRYPEISKTIKDLNSVGDT
jgi:hypothetical protein